MIAYKTNPNETQRKDRKSESKDGGRGRNNYFADEIFIVEVDICGVEEGDTTTDSMANEVDHVRFRLGLAIERSHAHAAEALRRRKKALGA